MSYRLELTAPVPDALRATAVERLERAAKRLREDHGNDPVGAVHGARKDLKGCRPQWTSTTSSAACSATTTTSPSSPPG